MEINSVAEQLFFTTVRIETIRDANQGGTGFIFNHQFGGNFYPFIVTNKHVVVGAKTGSVTFIKAQDGKPLLGQGFRVGVGDFQTGWVGHPDPNIDVTVASLIPFLERETRADRF